MVAPRGMWIIREAAVSWLSPIPRRPMRPSARAFIIPALPLLLTLAGCRLADVAGAVATSVTGAPNGTGDANGKWAGCYDHSCSGAPVAVPVVPPLASLTTQWF